MVARPSRTAPMSVFLAVDLDAATRALAASVSERLRPSIRASWVKAEKLHLTLVFLGNPEPAHLESLTGAVERLAPAHRPFSLELSGAGTFGTARAPSVLWLGVGGELAALRTLQGEAAATLLAVPLPDVKPEERTRPYAPHVTLARAKHGTAFDTATRELSAFSTPPFRVDALTLYESRHDAYRALHRVPLGAG